MKILFFISTLENGGAERAMSNITTHLPDDVEADILLNSTSEHDFPTKANIINLGMKSGSRRGLLYQIRALFKRIPALLALKRENNYDACISFMDSANICNILTGNKYCKCIVSVRTSLSTNLSPTRRYLINPLIRMLYNKADYVVACSQGIQADLVNILNIQSSKVKTITNGYDYEDIRSKMNQGDIGENSKFTFVTMGRFSAEKAQWHLIRAFAALTDKYDNIELIIMGQGDEIDYLEALVRESNIEDHVALLPYQKNPFSVLKKCDVFVMTSMWEGYCNALCEALVCGLPCISTDFKTSAREILAPDTAIERQITEGLEYGKYGILVPLCSGIKYDARQTLEQEEKFLSQAMEELYLNKNLLDEYRQKALIRAKELDISSRVAEWLKLASEVEVEK